MLESQKKILETKDSDYLNIGITQDGSPRNAIQVPWDRTASAFNMKTPNVYLSPQDLEDPEIMERLKEYHILGCYIFDPLEDYSFIGNFKELWDIHIRNGRNVTDLSFMKDLKDWFMFYLEDACIENLEPLFPKDHKKERFRSYCVGFLDCEVADISALEQTDLFLSELVVVYPKGANQRQRWKNAPASRYTYHEYE